jgi:hypothetical protein
VQREASCKSARASSREYRSSRSLAQPTRVHTNTEQNQFGMFNAGRTSEVEFGIYISSCSRSNTSDTHVIRAFLSNKSSSETNDKGFRDDLFLLLLGGCFVLCGGFCLLCGCGDPAYDPWAPFKRRFTTICEVILSTQACHNDVMML